ncbi:hypothetical protein PHLGIDRAFT_72041 [Phlebiopsis gigantea 11061_1 CR5-6]|uniref:DUF7702 domain-containing protein n=1 Tax=Phlebiopsis gigantea (strain 11061_1 CR5-6) TaxID=745531 RepID=A0A0C3NP25_PHLG1|nr:hypothetical protein PHLGIDRAFT_72041 [Phlebiopsis gigantea 11061_1 CR5-6]
MSSSEAINYARAEGIQHKELGAAVVFAILYIPCVPIFAYLSFKRYTFVWRSLVLFTLVRSAAFVLRALLAGSSTAGNNINTVIAEQVIYGIGFFGLLYSAYTLALDRDMFVNVSNSKVPGPLALITRIMRTRNIIRGALLAAVIMGIISGTEQGSSNASSQNTSESLRKASLYIFLVVSILLLFLTLMLAIDEFSVTHDARASFGRRYGSLVIFFIAAMCIVREAYLCATAGNVKKQNRPALFYPLSAAPEFIAMLLFLVPGLVPTKQELETREDAHVGILMQNYSPQPATEMNRTRGGAQQYYAPGPRA